MFSDKILLAITSHGWINCDDGDVDTFAIPEGIIVNKITISSPGNVNYVNETQLNKSMRDIKRQKKRILKSKKTSTVLTAIRDVTQDIKDVDYEEKKFLEDERLLGTIPEDDSEEERISDISQYLYGLDKAHKNYILNPGDIVINKKYMRENCEATKYDWSMPILNLPGEPDLLQLLRIQTRKGSCEITLSEIVNYFKNNGVKELVIFDFSCSVFYTDDNEFSIPKREVRSIRRDILKRGLPSGGKRIKTKKNQKRKRKNTYRRMKH